MKENVVAVIPVREGSQRVKNKNFRPFADELSLLHLKINQLKAANCFCHIYVSSDSEMAREIAEKNDVAGRVPGEALCPERFDLQELLKIRDQIGSPMFDYFPL